MNIETLYTNAIGRDVLGRFLPGVLSLYALRLLLNDSSNSIEFLLDVFPDGKIEPVEFITFVIVASYIVGYLLSAASIYFYEKMFEWSPKRKAKILNFYPGESDQDTVFMKRLRDLIPKFVFGSSLDQLTPKDVDHAVTALAKYMHGKDEEAYRNFVASRHILSRALRELTFAVALLGISFICYSWFNILVLIFSPIVTVITIWLLYRAAEQEYTWSYRHMYEWFLIDQRNNIDVSEDETN